MHKLNQTILKELRDTRQDQLAKKLPKNILDIVIKYNQDCHILEDDIRVIQNANPKNLEIMYKHKVNIEYVEIMGIVLDGDYTNLLRYGNPKILQLVLDNYPSYATMKKDKALTLGLIDYDEIIVKGKLANMKLLIKHGVTIYPRLTDAICKLSTKKLKELLDMDFDIYAAWYDNVSELQSIKRYNFEWCKRNISQKHIDFSLRSRWLLYAPKSTLDYLDKHKIPKAFLKRMDSPIYVDTLKVLIKYKVRLNKIKPDKFMHMYSPKNIELLLQHNYKLWEVPSDFWLVDKINVLKRVLWHKPKQLNEYKNLFQHLHIDDNDVAKKVDFVLTELHCPYDKCSWAVGRLPLVVLRFCVKHKLDLTNKDLVGILLSLPSKDVLDVMKRFRTIEND